MEHNVTYYDASFVIRADVLKSSFMRTVTLFRVKRDVNTLLASRNIPNIDKLDFWSSMCIKLITNLHRRSQIITCDRIQRILHQLMRISTNHIQRFTYDKIIKIYSTTFNSISFNERGPSKIYTANW